ncbi:MAG: leucine-rich repeat domain-containing protein, partial [Holosporales bacterium]|nr:leucine-rich repeat domain-containing protein [Holosporales bacterium]
DVEENKRNILDNIFSDTDRQVSVAGDCHAFFPDNTVYRRYGNAWVSLTSIADKLSFEHFVGYRNDRKEDCKKFLREVVWSSDIDEEIPDCVFKSCPNLSKVVLKDVKKIGEQVFADCLSLRQLTIPESVTSIGTNAFAGCRALMELTIPESVTSIGTGAFSATGLNVLHLKSQNINGVDFTKPGEDIVYVLNHLFYDRGGEPRARTGCRVVLADGNEYMFTRVGWRPTTKITFRMQEDIKAFLDYCGTYRDTVTKLREVVWDNPWAIPANLFGGCTNLWKIDFMGGEIKKRALAGYPDLKEITISRSARCCEGAFCGTRLRDIHFESWRSGDGSYDKTAAINFLNGVFFDDKADTVTAPEGCVAHFLDSGGVFVRTKAGWEPAGDMTTLCIDNETGASLLLAHRKRFPDAVNVQQRVYWSFSRIPAGIFSGGQNLRTVSLSSGIEDIGERAFADCVSLSEVWLPATVKTIGRGAFCGAGCNNIHCDASTINGQKLGIAVENTIAFLNGIFSDNTGNVRAEIGCTVQFPDAHYIRYEDTWGLKSCYVDGKGWCNVVVLDKNKVRQQVDRLSDPQNFVVAKDITEIGENAFTESGIRSVSFEENSRLEEIGEYAFCGCEQLTLVKLPPTVFAIGRSAFGYCTALQEIVIPKNVRVILEGAFHGSGLRKITFLSFPFVSSEHLTDFTDEDKIRFLTKIFSFDGGLDLSHECKAYFPDSTVYCYIDGAWSVERHAAPPQQLCVFFPCPVAPKPASIPKSAQQRSQMPGWPEQEASPAPPSTGTWLNGWLPAIWPFS